MTLQPWLSIACLVVCGACAGWSTANFRWYRSMHLPFSSVLTAFLVLEAAALGVGIGASVMALLAGWRG